MKIAGHDKNYSFDYVAWVNAVFDKSVDNGWMKKFTEWQWGISPDVMARFFQYHRVSFPTMLQIEFGSGVKMIDFVIKIN